MLRSADGGDTPFGPVSSPAKSDDGMNIEWGLAAPKARFRAGHGDLSLRGVELAAEQIDEAGSISRRKLDGRDQVRRSSHRAGLHGIALNAQPASLASR